MSYNLKLHLLHALRLAPVFVFSLLVVTPGQYALADASGCSRFGIDGLTCIAVKGHGLRVYSIKAHFNKATTLCNWRYDIVYTQTNGTNYSTRKGPTHPGCNFSGDLPVTYTPYTTVRTGKVCAQLYSDGSYVDAACVSLFP